MNDNYNRDLLQTVGDAKLISTSTGFVIDLHCAEGHTVTEKMGGRRKMPPEAINRFLCNKGWKTGRKLICPDHAKGERKMPSITVADVPKPEPTPAAKRIHRTVMEALMLVYDEDRKDYNEGYSDNRVATETGAALGYVQKTREDYFGPLKEPGELQAIRREMAELYNEVEKFRADSNVKHADFLKAFSTIKSNIDGLSKKNGWA